MAHRLLADTHENPITSRLLLLMELAYGTLIQEVKHDAK